MIVAPGRKDRSRCYSRPVTLPLETTSLSQFVQLTILTPRRLRVAMKLAPTLIRDTLQEAARACATERDELRLDSCFGWATGKGLRRLAHVDDLTDTDVAQTVATAMCETLQTTGPNRTALGHALSRFSARMVWERQSTHSFFVEPADQVTRDAQRGADRIAAGLPSFYRAAAVLLRRSTEALQDSARRHGWNTIRVFRGVTGAEAPCSKVDARGASYRMRPLATWSTSFDDAHTFAIRSPGGCVLEAIAPAGTLVLAPGFAELKLMLAPVRIEAIGRAETHHEFDIVDVHRAD
jgi:hypothetical protein